MNRKGILSFDAAADATFTIVVTTALYAMPMVLPVGTTGAEALAAHKAQVELAGAGDQVALVADGVTLIDCQL